VKNELKEIEMTTRPRSHVIEGLSRTRATEVFVRAGWVVEHLHEDYGEDLYVRIFVESKATPLAFFVQLKATDHIDRYLSAGTVGFSLERRHLSVWTGFWEPVILILYDSKTENCYWESVTHFLETDEGRRRIRSSSKNIKIEFPSINLLDECGIVRISNLVKHRFRQLSSERAGADLLLQLLEQKGGVQVESYDTKNEVLILRSNDGGSDHYYFGRLGKLTRLLEARKGISVKDTILEAAREAPTYPRVIQDSAGRVLFTINNDEELRFYAKRLDEFHDIDEEILKLSKK